MIEAVVWRVQWYVWHITLRRTSSVLNAIEALSAVEKGFYYAATVSCIIEQHGSERPGSDAAKNSFLWQNKKHMNCLQTVEAEIWDGQRACLKRVHTTSGEITWQL